MQGIYVARYFVVSLQIFIQSAPKTKGRVLIVHTVLVVIFLSCPPYFSAKHILTPNH